MNVRLIQCCGCAPLETPNVFHITPPDRPHALTFATLQAPYNARGVQFLLLNFTFEVVVAGWPLETLHPVNSQRSSPQSTQPGMKSLKLFPPPHIQRPIC